MAKEHSGGTPEFAWTKGGKTIRCGSWEEESYPVPITHFPYADILAKLDGPDAQESEAAIAARASLKVLRDLLKWARGEGRLGGQRTRWHVLYRVFLAEDYDGKTDLEMARLAGLRSKQAFSKEKLRFARAYHYRERNMRSDAACQAMRRSYEQRHQPRPRV
jgi:hypothetical protein